MKRYFLIILPLLLLFSVEAKSQVHTYRSFPDSGIIWQGYLFCGVHSMSENWPWAFSVTGDTGINGFTYLKIGRVDYTIGLVREDSSKRVYGLNVTGYDDDTTTLERPLYDFSLEAGDTMFSGKTFFVVDSVDTIGYYGIERKTLYTREKNFNSFNDIWIEGIGSVQGPMANWRTYYEVCHASYLCLARQDTTTLARVTTFSGGCAFLNPIDEIIIQKTIKIAPNPCSSSFHLQLSSLPTNSTSFQLYDALGRQIKREEIISETTRIQRGNLPAGIYFWQIRQGDKILERGKLIME